MKFVSISGGGQAKGNVAHTDDLVVETPKVIGKDAGIVWFEEVYTNVVREVSKDVSRQSFLRAISSRKGKRGRK